MAKGDKKPVVMGEGIVNDLTTGGASAALSAEMGKVLGRRPNPNLLHNWYFENPVNQRGQAEYQHSGNSAGGYTIDRWRTTNDTSVISCGEDGITVRGTTKIGTLRQIVEFPAQLYGKTVTISALMSDGTINCDTKLIPLPSSLASGATATVAQAVFSDGYTLSLYLQFDGVVMVQFRVPIDGEITIVAAKLELGSTQTLAHQDSSGNWVLNEIPDYGEELAKCQRYFLRVNPDPFGTGYTVGGGNNADIVIPTPQTMRAIPALVTDGTFMVRTNGSDYTGTSNTVTTVANNSVEVRVYASGIPERRSAVGYLSGATYFYLDANL